MSARVWGLLSIWTLCCFELIHATKSPTSCSVYKHKLPFSIDVCAGSNKLKFARLIWKTSSKCSILTARRLKNSKALKTFWSVWSKIFKDPSQTTNIIYQYMSTVTEDKKDNNMEHFCNDWSEYLIPCLNAYIPGLIEIAENDPKCCSGFTDALDMLNIFIPPEKWAGGLKTRVQTFVNQLARNVQESLCSKRTLDLTTRKETTKDFCGSILFRQLLDKSKEKGSSLLKSTFFPLYTIPQDHICPAMEGKTYVDTASLTPVATLQLGCCIHRMRPLIQQMTSSFEYVFGSPMVEILNGMIAWDSSISEKKQFVDSLSAVGSCSFADYCEHPDDLKDIPLKGSMASSSPTTPIFSPEATALIRNNTPEVVKVAPKFIVREPGCHAKLTLGEINCDIVSQCVNGAYHVCRDVCQRGTIKVSPWLQSALKFQRDLAYTGPMCLAQIPATHNSAINAADGYGIFDKIKNIGSDCTKPWSYIKTDNQFLSLTDQLQLGVRFIELDTHYFNGDFYSAHCGDLKPFPQLKAFLNGFVEQLKIYGHVQWTANLLGCWPSISGIGATSQIKTHQHLDEIAAWVGKNDDFMILYIDNGAEIAEQGKWTTLNALIQSKLKKYLVPKEKVKAIEANDWKNAKFQDFIIAGYRILLLGNDETDIIYPLRTFCGSEAYVITDLVNVEADLRTMKLGNVPIHSDHVFTRTYQEELRVFTVNPAGKWSHANPVFLTPDTISRFVRWNINLIAPDMIDNSKMQAMIWSWNQDEPKYTQHGTPIYMGRSGRWFTERASYSTWQACFKESPPSWEIVAVESPCPKGHTLKLPTDAFFNYLLMIKLSYLPEEVTSVQIALYGQAQQSSHGIRTARI